MPPGSLHFRPSRVGWLLVLLLVWSVGLRLVYASTGLHVHRFWDEHWTEPNVYEALENGRLTPVRYQYLRLTYLPQVAVLGGVQSVAKRFDPEFSWFHGESMGPAAVLICRSMQTLWGGLSILFTFLLGRRLFSPEVGLVGAFLVAVAPFHFMLSAVFKPDVLLCATMLLAFWWTLDALEHAGLGRYLLAGLGIGLALSSKPTGGAVAIPLTLGALVLGWKNRRHWLGLVLAGVVSLVLFLLLNPNLPRYLAAFEQQQEFYRSRVIRIGGYGGPMGLAWTMLESSFVGYHGRWIGLAAAAGMVMLLVGVWSSRGAGHKTRGRTLLLVLFAVYSALYVVVAKHIMGQNLLPLLPFSSLAAAALLVAAWRKLPRSLASPAMVIFAISAGALLAAHRVHALTYKVWVPSTRAQTVGFLDDHAEGKRFWVRWRPIGSQEPPQLELGFPSRPSPQLLFFGDRQGMDDPFGAEELMDAEVMVDEDERETQEASDDAEEHLFAGVPFRARGPLHRVVFHAWTRVASENGDWRRRPAYRFVEREGWMPLRIDQLDRSILIDNNQCRRLLLPDGARARVGFGLNRTYLRSQGVHRFTAEFKLQLGSSQEGAAVEVLMRRMMRLHASDGRRPGEPYWTEIVDLDRFAGERVNLCVRTRVVGQGARADILGVAFWDQLEIVDDAGRRHRDTFRHRLAADVGTAAALVFRLPTVAPEQRPEVHVGGGRLRMVADRGQEETIWTTERFTLRNDAVAVEVVLPEPIEAHHLRVEVLRFEQERG